MGKKKQATARVCAAGSSGSKEIENLKTRNEQLEYEVAESRKQIEQLRLELQKTQNNKLIKEVKELRKQIEQLNLEFATQTSEKDILADMECDVIRLAISSALAEATVHRNKEIATVIKKKVESAAAELNVVEMRLVSLDREKDAVQKEIKLIVEERLLLLSLDRENNAIQKEIKLIAEKRDLRLRSLEQKRKSANLPRPEHGGRIRRKWIYPVAAAAASFFVVTAAVILFCSKNSILRT